MAPRGRPPKPAAAKRMLGNPGRREIQDEPELEPLGDESPEELGGVALKEWKRILPILQNRGIVTAGDRALLCAYCVAWEQWVEGQAKTRRYGSVIVKKDGGAFFSPYFGLTNSAAKTLQRLASELGLSPVSRARMGVAAQQADTGKDGFFNDG